jgi:molybdopterin converting factor small subunit
MAKLFIPTALRAFTDRNASIDVDAANVGAAIDSLAEQYPDIRQHLYDEDGALRSYVNLFVGDTNIRDLQGLDTPIGVGSEVMLVPAIAGGARC